jgi:hypothetical protein
MGRLRYSKDQDKGLRQMTDYYFSQLPHPTLTANIIATHEVHQVVRNVTVQYTAGSTNCGITPLTYDWYIDGVKLGNNTTTFQYQFTQVKAYVLKLVVSHPVYQSVESTVVYDVKDIHSINPIAVTVADNAGTNAYAYCDANHTKTFAASFTGCYVLPDVNIDWYYKTPSSGWQRIDMIYSQPTLVFDPVLTFNGESNLSSYQIKCEVSTVCPITGVAAISTSIISISYNGSTQCQ